MLAGSLVAHVGLSWDRHQIRCNDIVSLSLFQW